MSDNIIIIPATPPHCPSCGDLESTKTVCRHCGYEYKNDESWLSIIGVLLTILAIIAVLGWFGFTILSWVAGYEPTTLLKVLQGQWHWLTKLRLW